jgi:hypothetical protein
MTTTLRSQLRDNFVALVSLTVALASFSYTAWRMEHSETNLTTRQAAFQLLTALGQMQELVYLAHYDHDAMRGNPRSGWVYVMTINDFSATMPASVQSRAAALLVVWRNHWEGLMATRDTDADAISDALEACRGAVVTELRALH